MRKYIRNIIRYRAKQKDTKPSTHVKTMFDYIQRKKYGSDCRSRNQARGTHKRYLWPYRVAASYSK